MLDKNTTAEEQYTDQMESDAQDAADYEDRMGVAPEDGGNPADLPTAQSASDFMDGGKVERGDPAEDRVIDDGHDAPPEEPPETDQQQADEEAPPPITDKVGCNMRWQVAWTDGVDRDLTKLPGHYRDAMLVRALDQLLAALNIAPDVLLLHAIKKTVVSWGPEIFMETMKSLPPPPGQKVEAASIQDVAALAKQHREARR